MNPVLLVRPLRFPTCDRSWTPHLLTMPVRLVGVMMTPQVSQLPGGSVLQRLMNGLQGWALALALVGLVIGAAAWALGSHGQNYQQTFVGRRAVLISGLAALLIGAGPGIVNFFFGLGQNVH
ncbi:MAG: DUF6112 family protein [Acidimicrobiales bacterium]